MSVKSKAIKKEVQVGEKAERFVLRSKGERVKIRIGIWL